MFSSFNLATFQVQQQNEQAQRHGQQYTLLFCSQLQALTNNRKAEGDVLLQPDYSSLQSTVLTVTRNQEPSRLQPLCKASMSMHHQAVHMKLLTATNGTEEAGICTWHMTGSCIPI